jgi:hypothetical protein
MSDLRHGFCPIFSWLAVRMPGEDLNPTYTHVESLGHTTKWTRLWGRLYFRDEYPGYHR